MRATFPYRSCCWPTACPAIATPTTPPTESPSTCCRARAATSPASSTRAKRCRPEPSTIRNRKPGSASRTSRSSPAAIPRPRCETLDDVVKAYQTHGAPADLVEAQKKREIAQDLFSRNSIEGLANDWSQAVAIQGLNSPDDMIALFNKVTPDDVTRVFRRYFVRRAAVAGILAPKPGAVPSSSGTIGVKDTFSSNATKPVPLPVWASQLQTVEIPQSTLSPVDEMLPNGIRLIVQPLSISPTVTLRGQIKNEPAFQTPPGKRRHGRASCKGCSTTERRRTTGSPFRRNSTTSPPTFRQARSSRSRFRRTVSSAAWRCSPTICCIRPSRRRRSASCASRRSRSFKARSSRPTISPAARSRRRFCPRTTRRCVIRRPLP